MWEVDCLSFDQLGWVTRLLSVCKLEKLGGCNLKKLSFVFNCLASTFPDF